MRWPKLEPRAQALQQRKRRTATMNPCHGTHVTSRSAIKPKIGAYLSDDVTARTGMAVKRLGTPKLKFVNDPGTAGRRRAASPRKPHLKSPGGRPP